MNFVFNERRSTQAAAFLVSRNGGTMNYMKLIKLLYLADRTALLRWQQPITGDKYYSMPRGPVVSTILDIISNGPNPHENGYWSHAIKKSPDDGYAVTAVAPVEYDDLSAREKRLLTDIDEHFKAFDQWAMVDYCHKNLPEWNDPQGPSAQITVEEIIRAGSPTATEEEIQESLELIEFKMFIDQENIDSLHEAG